MYGPMFTYRMGPQRVLAIADAAIAEQLLRDRPDTYRRPSIVEPVFQEMGVAGVFSAEGVAWRAQRRLAMQALSQRQIRASYESLRTVTNRFAQRWQQYADRGAELDVVEEMKRFTVDVTTLLVFGHDVNTIENGTDVIQRNLELIFPTFNRRLFALVPTWRWLRMPADRRVDRALAELRTWLGARVADVRKQVRENPARADRPANFIESMLTSRDADGQPFSDDVIFGNAMTMLLAGEDTTAFTLAWAIHHLCDTPHAVARLQDESAAVLLGDVAPVDFEAAGRLAYAGAVANEAMRMRPVAPTIFLENNADVIIADVAVPARTWIVLLTRPPAMKHTSFADPETFRPERWLDDAPAGTSHETGAHMPFGSGPRICPGRSLALLEMKLVLSMIYRLFDVERVGDTANVREAFAFTMSPVGLNVRLRRRALD
jgi:cytochrome P450